MVGHAQTREAFQMTVIKVCSYTSEKKPKEREEQMIPKGGSRSLHRSMLTSIKCVPCSQTALMFTLIGILF